MERLRVFDGRIIFDHQPKAAGQAVSAWLRSQLGAGCVTANLIGDHRELIRGFGGQFSVICGHLAFNGEGLDPRYRYITCFREPISRTQSWLSYLLQQTATTEPELFLEAERFVNSSGEGVYSSAFLSSVSNWCTTHFCSILGGGEQLTDDQKLNLAMEAVAQYSVVGFFDDLLDFAKEVSSLLGMTPPQNLQAVNVTSFAPSNQRAITKLRPRLVELNQLDIDFFSRVRRHCRDRAGSTAIACSPPLRTWDRYDGFDVSPTDETKLALLGVKAIGEDVGGRGRVLGYEVRYCLLSQVENFELGLHIFNDRGSWAFGTNTTLLNKSFPDAGRIGTYTAETHFVVDLPPGRYTIGFAFSSLDAQLRRHFGWFEALGTFQVVAAESANHVGYADLPIDVRISRVQDEVVSEIADARGSLTLTRKMDEAAVGELIDLPLELVNDSQNQWSSTFFAPIECVYTWTSNNDVAPVSCGRRGLSLSQFPANTKSAIRIQFLAPDVPGDYLLTIDLARGSALKFEDRGFAPLRIPVRVLPQNAARTFCADDLRLQSEIGALIGGGITSTGKEGFLLYGPYIRVDEGLFEVELEGRFEHCENCKIQIACREGTYMLTEQAFCDSPNLTTAHSVICRIPETVFDLEVRVWVTSQAKVRLDFIHLRYVDAAPRIERSTA